MKDLPIAKDLRHIVHDPEDAFRTLVPPFPVADGRKDAVKAFAKRKEGDEFLEIRTVINGVDGVHMTRPFVMGRTFFVDISVG